MKCEVVRGMICKGMIPKPIEVTIGAETKNGFSTLSLSLSDDKDTLIQIAVTPAVKEVLQSVCKERSTVYISSSNPYDRAESEEV